jgi:hypothetical protein
MVPAPQKHISETMNIIYFVRNYRNNLQLRHKIP